MHLVEYAVRYFKSILKKHSRYKNRKTEISIFESISIRRVVVANKKLYVNKKEGFVGYGLKQDDYNDENEDQKESKEVIGNPNNNNFEFYINPQIDHSSRKSIQEGEEGCLSIPEIRLVAERFDKIKIRYYNENGKKIKKPLDGFLSRLFQHELDHLDGVLMVENSKIKNVYQISENENVQNLYSDLVNKLKNFQ